MSEELKSNVELKLEEKMLFKCNLGKLKIDELYIDLRKEKRMKRIGPSPVKLLGISVLSCLAASLEFCIEKENFSLSDLDGRAEVTVARDRENFWRIKKIDVEMIPKIDNPELLKRIEQCKKLFEQYCIISESLKKGIEINVNLEY
ncbi:MAG: OsmC family protein [Candidatus Odinarchaeota archaeon]